MISPVFETINRIDLWLSLLGLVLDVPEVLLMVRHAHRQRTDISKRSIGIEGVKNP